MDHEDPPEEPMVKPFDRAQLDALPAVEPPADFAARVVAAWQRESGMGARPGWRRGGLLAGAAALALLATLALAIGRRPSPSPSLMGELRAAHVVAARATFRLGHRAVAVAEGGTSLSWEVAGDGSARVQQGSGDTFYRVESGGPFEVHTPAGDVRVLGTCFRVEVQPMRVSKQSLAAAGVGAAVASLVLITVYEGRVLLANERGQAELRAGERGFATGGDGPRRLDTTAASATAAGAPTGLGPAAAPDASRAELMRRDREQRGELAALRARVQDLERAAANGAGRARDDFAVHPDAAELTRMASECRLTWDAPSLGLTPALLGADNAARAGLSDEERQQYNRVLGDLNARTLTQLRGLYVEVTGDKAGADTLTPHSLEEEITRKSPEAALQEAFWRLSRERAGLLPAGSAASGSPIERMMRLMTGLGDGFERELGAAIGPDRARALRDAEHGWGSRHNSSNGCPAAR